MPISAEIDARPVRHRERDNPVNLGAEIGHHHHLAGPYLIRFAQKASWREDQRREANGEQVDRLVALAMTNRPSVDFCGIL